MKIANWNLSAVNRDIIKSLDFILVQEPDIISLQEVTEEGLAYLKTKDYDLVHELESHSAGEIHTYLVLMTKYKIKSTGSFKFYNKPIKSWWRKSKWIDKHWGTSDVQKYLYIDIESPLGIKRIYNIHLTWEVGPRIRMEQLDNFLDKAKLEGDEIICGDFNTISSPLYNVFAALPFCYKKEDFSINESKEVEKRFKPLGFKNPYKGHSSWSLIIRVKAQLDYILIPERIQIKRQSDYKANYGSDHKPQVIELH